MRWSDETVAVAENGWALASTDGVKLPVSVVIVDNMDESPSDTWHPLHQPFPKVVVCHCNLHPLVLVYHIVCTQQHHLQPKRKKPSYICACAYVVVVGEVGVGDGDACGTINGVNESILASGHGDMVNPDVAGPEDGEAVAISPCPEPIMINGIPDHTAVAGDNVMDVKTMDDDVGDELHGDTSSISDVNVCTTSIDGLVAVDHELLLQPYVHVVLEDDP